MLVEYLTDHNKRVTPNVTRNLILSTFVLGLSVFTYGFETTVISTTQAMTRKQQSLSNDVVPFSTITTNHRAFAAFERKFGESLPGQNRVGFTSAKLSYLNSLPLIAYAVGVVLGAQVGERWGRKVVLVGMNIVCIIGCLICITSKSYGQMLAGRMVVYIHVGIEAWLVPMLQAELVPAAVRGTFVAFYAFDHIFAGLASLPESPPHSLNRKLTWNPTDFLHSHQLHEQDSKRQLLADSIRPLLCVARSYHSAGLPGA